MSSDDERKQRERERKRLERERRKRGEIVVPVIVSRKTRDVLVDARWLPEWSEDDREAVREAAQRLLDGIAPVTRD